MSNTTIANALTTRTGDITATVMSLDQVKTGQGQNGPWTRQGVQLSDGTGTITLMAWGNRVNTFQVGKTYSITGGKYKDFSGAVQLTLQKYSVVQEIVGQAPTTPAQAPPPQQIQPAQIPQVQAAQVQVQQVQPAQVAPPGVNMADPAVAAAYAQHAAAVTPNVQYLTPQQIECAVNDTRTLWCLEQLINAELTKLEPNVKPAAVKCGMYAKTIWERFQALQQTPPGALP